jgi:peptidoglycan/LPS O-acetylase OafA/YrhL
LLVALFHLEALSHVYHLPLVRNAFLFVDFFFVLSGFVISNAYAANLHDVRDFKRFVIRRFGRVWPLHVVTLAAFVFAEVLNLLLAQAIGFKTGRPPFDPEGYRPLAAIPLHFVLVQAMGVADRLTWNHPSWSISAELWTYLVFAGVSVYWPKQKSIALPALGLAAALAVACWSKTGIEVTYDLGFARCLYGFAAGHVCWRLYQSGIRVGGHPVIVETATVAAVFLFVWIAGRGPLSLAAPLVFGAAVLVFASEAGPVSRNLRGSAWQWLGRLSFSIYMGHAFLATQVWVLATILQKVAGRPLFAEFVGPGGAVHRTIANVSPWLLDAVAVGYLAAVIGLASLTWRYVEEPGQRYFARLATAATASRPIEKAA